VKYTFTLQTLARCFIRFYHLDKVCEQAELSTQEAMIKELLKGSHCLVLPQGDKGFIQMEVSGVEI